MQIAKPATKAPIRPESTNNRVMFVIRNSQPQAGQWNLRGFQTFKAKASENGALHFGQFIYFALAV